MTLPNDDFDDNPEWTEEDLRHAKCGKEVLPALFGEETARFLLQSGQKTFKTRVTLNLDQEVARRWTNGKDRENRLNEFLSRHSPE